ncbi:MAG: ATP-dependent DNA helicase RecG [Nocardioides sp.]
MIDIDSPIETVLGDASAKRGKFIDGLGLRTVGDLLAHHPRRYLKTGELSRIARLEVGQLISVVGEVSDIATNTYRDRRTGRTAYRHDITVRTDGPPLRISFFAKRKNMAERHARRVPERARGIFTGLVGRFRGEWQLTNPSLVMFGSDDSQVSEIATLAELPPLFPLYPLTKGLDSIDVRRAVAFARSMVDEIPELLPESVRKVHGLPDARQALEYIHEPNNDHQVAQARRRYRFEEALITQVVLARRRIALRAVGAAARVGRDDGLLAEFDRRLPFTLTAGQASVRDQIFADLARPHPMNRLLQGEVGSGKTVVALGAMLRVVDSGAQAALLAPTEVLAQQHFRSITALLGDLGHGGMLGGHGDGTTVALLTGSMSAAAKRRSLSALAGGDAGLVIGTHALLQDRVDFADLGLVVVDEQHRFGVEQRATLTDKAGSPPHVLVMTATPIPRSVAMTIFGDLEVSTLSELPAGRGAVQSNVVPLAEHPHWMDRVWQRVREEAAGGHQVYVVCPRISGDLGEQDAMDPSDRPAASGADGGPGTESDPGPVARSPLADKDLAAVEEVYADVSAGALSGLRIAMLHGRMPADDKDRTMRAFAGGELDVVISTTVIEVGVDVPNATTMVILDADRFGVSQLHQLRGRVGRGGLPGLCLLVTRTDPAQPARERLEAVAATNDGFALSRIDLEQRREGDVLGASQSGRRSSLHTLRVLRDEETIVRAREAAEGLLMVDPMLDSALELREAVVALEQSQAGEFIEKS